MARQEKKEIEAKEMIKLDKKQQKKERKQKKKLDQEAMRRFVAFSEIAEGTPVVDVSPNPITQVAAISVLPPISRDN